VAEVGAAVEEAVAAAVMKAWLVVAPMTHIHMRYPARSARAGRSFRPGHIR
jgi:hypothetical protein